VDNKNSIAENLIKARVAILLNQPYLSKLKYFKIVVPPLVIVEMDEAEIVATQNGDQILLNIATMKNMSNAQIDAVIMHEIYHAAASQVAKRKTG